MNILDLRATVGPNIYSVDYPQLIVLRVKFDTFDGKIAADYSEAGLAELFAPDNYDPSWPVGFVLAELAARLQRWVGLESRFTTLHRVRDPGVENVVFEYTTAASGLLAGQKAVELLQSAGDPAIAELKTAALAAVRQAWRESRLLLSTEALVQEAASRGIPYVVLNDRSLVQLGYGCHQQRIQDTLTEYTSAIGVDLAGDKFAANDLLRGMDLPVPRDRIVTDEAELADALDEIGFPLVVKPVGGHQGQGVTTGVATPAEALQAFHWASRISSRVLVEEHVAGEDFRVLVVNNRFVAAARREAAMVVGDGIRTVKALVAEANQDPRRGFDHERPLTFITLDEHADEILLRQGLTLESVPPPGLRVRLQTGANISTGGTATDVTREVHPSNARLFERIAWFIGLDVAGLDVVARNLSEPIEKTGGRIIEINAAPGFRMHLYPSAGDSTNVCAPVIDRLFPVGRPSRIPILAVTGTNGKTTTTRLLAHIMRSVGRRVGFTSSDGIYLGLQRIKSGDMTGPTSTRLVLKDPWVDTAVFEYPRGGLIRAGLGFDRCEVGIVTNVCADHLGSRDIHTIEEMAHVKSVLIRAVLPQGYAVLNADDDLVYAMREAASGNVALFSLRANNPRIAAHREENGLGAILENGRVVLYRGSWSYPLGPAADFPMTFGGQAPFMIQNVLAAGLAAFCHGLSPQVIRATLRTFDPGAALTPGRMNFLYGDGFRVLVDYAHNLDSMRALDQFLAQRRGLERLVAVVGGTGDRLDDDIVALGHQTGLMFDRVIIREDEDTRGRTRGETAEIFRRGVVAANSDSKAETILDSDAAIRHAILTAAKDDLICVLGGDVEQSLATVRQFCRPTR